MEASAINIASQASTQVPGPRAPSAPQPRSGEAVDPLARTEGDASTEAAKQAVAQRKAAERENARAAGGEAPPSVGRIRFELDDGTRVAKFFDTKDILIYQVPPEGRLYLVRVQEAGAQEQIETSA